MDLCEASRVCKKIVPWLPRENQDWRVALETVINFIDTTRAEMNEEIKTHLHEMIAELEKVS